MSSPKVGREVGREGGGEEMVREREGRETYHLYLDVPCSLIPSFPPSGQAVVHPSSTAAPAAAAVPAEPPPHDRPCVIANQDDVILTMRELLLYRRSE